MAIEIIMDKAVTKTAERPRKAAKASGTAEAVNNVTTLPVEAIRPFKGHPFHLYKGARLDDMVDSIKKNGVLTPVIVRPSGKGYEMLAGHNRLQAAKLAGLTEIPAIVKEGLTDEEALAYVIETNMIQRSFSEMLPSEKAAVLQARYQNVCSQRKRQEIEDELLRLKYRAYDDIRGKEEALQAGGHDVHQGGENEAGGHDVHKGQKSRDAVGNEYGMTGRNIARYIRCNNLIQEFKDALDSGEITLITAVNLSYLEDSKQLQVNAVAAEGKYKLTPKASEELRKYKGELSEDIISEILSPARKTVKKTSKNEIPPEIYFRYFAEAEPEEIKNILDQALEMYYQTTDKKIPA